MFILNFMPGISTCNPPIITMKYKRKLAYLESTGTQYIDTQIKLTNNHSVEIDYQLTAVPETNARKGLYGGLVANVARYGSLVSPTTRCMEYGYGVGNTYYQTSIPDTSRHIIKQEKNKVYFDGVLIYTFKEATFQMPTNALLGTFNYTDYTPALARYYSSRWWNGDTLVRDFIPVLDLNDVPCMYDKVSGQFFYNQGTGTFKYEELPQLPIEYQEVEYIESTGTQYIDTGLDYFADFEVGIRLRQNVSNKALGNGQSYCLQRQNADTGCWQYTSASTTYNTTIKITDYHIMMWKDNKVYADGVELANLVKNSNVGSRMFLFTSQINSPYPNIIYFCKLYNNGTLVRDFVPCYRKSDRVAGLYDLANGEFYTNKGTGEFLYG